MGNVKHEALIIKDIVKCLENGCGIITQEKVIEIISKYYSAGYSEKNGFKFISRSLSKQGIATETKVKIPPSISLKMTAKNISPNNQFVTVFISNKIPKAERPKAVASFMRDYLHTFVNPIHRSISREILEENQPPQQQKAPECDFFSMRVRVMLLHLFLLTTFKDEPFDPSDVLFSMPIGLSMQILRDIDPKYFILNPAILVPPDKEKTIEIESVLSMLRPPYNALIIDGKLQRYATIELPWLSFSKTYDFFNDPLAHFQYWTLVSAVSCESNYKYPITVCQRFETYVSRVLEETALYCLPFFPREVENFAWETRLPVPVISFALQKIFKKKLRLIEYPRHSFLESKLFPQSGTASFIVTKQTALPIDPIVIPSVFSEKIEPDGSIETLAKAILLGKLSKNGFIMKRKNDFTKLLEIAGNDTKCFNMVTSLFNDPRFVEIYKIATARVLIEMHNLEVVDESDSCLKTADSIIKGFSVANRFVDVDHSTAVAMEFLKPVLSDGNIIKEIAIRQIVHLRPDDLASAIAVLSTMGIYSEDAKRFSIRYPKCSWYFDDFYFCTKSDNESIRSIIARPALIYFIESDVSTYRLEWSGAKNILYFSIGDEENQSFIERQKSEIFKFDFVKTREKLPPLIIEDEEEDKKEVEEKEKPTFDAISTDPLSRFGFGKTDQVSAQFHDLTERYLYDIICSSEVDGIGMLEISQTFDCPISSETMRRLLDIIESFIRLGLVVRMPSTNIEPYWSIYPCCGMMYRKTERKVEFAPVHMWMTHNANINQETIDNLRRNIATYVLAHPNCTFEELMETFLYVSPYDLCIVLNALEADDVLESNYAYEVEGDLFNEPCIIPAPCPYSIDVFLGMIAEQRLIDSEKKFVRRVKTYTDSLFNLCV